MFLSRDEFNKSSLILKVCIVTFFVSTSAAFVACVAMLTKDGKEFSDVSTSALFILLGFQSFLSLISGYRDGSFLLLGRRQPLIRHAMKGSNDFRRFTIVNAIFVLLAIVHVYFIYLR
jgi:hypothetical protein